MTALPEHMQRCSRHPHQVLVGVCAWCLRERLVYVAKASCADGDNARIPSFAPPNDRDEHDADEQDADHRLHGHDREHPHAVDPHPLPPSHSFEGKQKLKTLSAAQQHLPFLHRPSQPSSEGGFPASEEKPPVSSSAKPPLCNALFSSPECKFAPTLVPRKSNASESEGPLQPDIHPFTKKSISVTSALPLPPSSSSSSSKSKKASWFPLSKSKASSVANSPLMPAPPLHGNAVQQSFVRRRSGSVHNYMISEGRKSASEAVFGTNHPMNFAYPSADRLPMAEINLGESAISLDNADINLEAPPPALSSSSSSWISTLFNIRKHKPKSRLGSTPGAIYHQCANHSSNGSVSSAHHPNDTDVGRLSFDAAKPRLRNMLKRMDRGKEHKLQVNQINDHVLNTSPLVQSISHPNVLSLRKCNSVASTARSSVSGDIPNNAVFHGNLIDQSIKWKAAGLAQNCHMMAACSDQFDVANGIDATDYEEEDDAGSGSWGSRAWNKTMSPLYKGFNRKQSSSMQTGRRKADAKYRDLCGAEAVPNLRL